MKKQRKQSHVETTAERPKSKTADQRPVLTEVARSGNDSEHDRQTLETFASREDQADPAKRKMRPMWLIIPAVIALVLLIVIWGGSYLVEGLSG